MPTTATPRNAASRHAAVRRFGWVLPVIVIVLALLWAAQGPLLRTAVRLALPTMARSAGFDLDFDELETRFSGPLLLGNVRLRDGRGSELRAARVELSVAAAAELFTHPQAIFRRVKIGGLSGELRLRAAAGAGEGPAAVPPRLPFSPAWPAVIEVEASKLSVSRGDRQLFFRDTQIQLTEGSTGRFRAGAIVLRAGRWTKNFSGVGGVTAWRDGVVYLADVALGEDAVMELFSFALDVPAAITLRARAFGGTVYAEWTDAGARTTAALSAFDCQLDGLGRLLGLASPLRGELGLFKFVFNGDPSAPLEAQSSLRAEVKDFSWAKRSFAELQVGMTLSGRLIKVDQLLLAQQSNRVTARGSVGVPHSDWRGSGIALDLDLQAGDVQALGDLYGAPWNKLSGTAELQAKVTGLLGAPSGWLKARGKNLRLPGVPPGLLQADLAFGDGYAKVTALELRSGADFVRASGEVSLKEPLAYRGRLEARLREVSRYLENLGRFAPDWAKRGGAFVFWDGDGAGEAHSGVITLELFDFTGELNPVPLNGKLAATYAPGNVYASRLFFDRGPLSLSASCHLSDDGLSVQDIQLFDLRRRLLRGEIFLPVSYPLLLEGKPWSQTMLPGREIRAMVRSDDLRLGPLANLLGQKATVEGRVDWKLDVTGPWENPSAESVFTVDGFRAGFEAFAIPSSQLTGQAKLASQRLEVTAELRSGPVGPVQLAASIPLLGQNKKGGWRFLDRAEPVSARLDIPALDLQHFAGPAPLSGELSGSVSLAGQLSAPLLEGVLSWTKVSLTPVAGLDAVSDFSGQYVLAGPAGKFENANGKMGGGTFTLEGSGDFSDLLKIGTTAKISGKNLQLLSRENCRLAADVDLAVDRTADRRTVTGNVALVGSSIGASLSVSPFLTVDEAAPKAVALTAPFRGGGWLGDCHTKIRIQTASPLPLAAGGTAAVDVWLTGQWRDCVPVGRVEFSGLRADLPAGRMSFSRARFAFASEMPWVPIVDLTGRTRVGAYEVAATAWGPLGEQQVRLESIPEMSPDQIALLLGAGLAPEADLRGGEFRAGEPETTRELPPPQIGWSWRVK